MKIKVNRVIPDRGMVSKRGLKLLKEINFSNRTS